MGLCAVKFYWNCAHGNGFGERFRSNFIHVYDIYNRAHLYLAELNWCMFIAFIFNNCGLSRLLGMFSLKSSCDIAARYTACPIGRLIFHDPGFL